MRRGRVPPSVCLHGAHSYPAGRDKSERREMAEIIRRKAEVSNHGLVLWLCWVLASEVARTGMRDPPITVPPCPEAIAVWALLSKRHQCS